MIVRRLVRLEDVFTVLVESRNSLRFDQYYLKWMYKENTMRLKHRIEMEMREASNAKPCRRSEKYLLGM